VADGSPHSKAGQPRSITRISSVDTRTPLLNGTAPALKESLRPGVADRPIVPSQTPRAAVFAEPKEIRIEEVDLSEPGPGEVRVRLEGCGVCASNIPVWEGRPWFEYPMQPGATGHEGWGVVDAIGEGVEHLAEGDRVAMLSYHAYATHDIAQASAVVKLPHALDDRPFPGEPLGCAMNIFKRSEIEPGQMVSIVGIGFLGALLTKLATDAGARVIAISRRAYSLDVAREAGAAELIPMDDHWKIIEQVKSLTGGTMCDRVIEAVGKQEPLDLAAELTCERGRLMIAGYHQDGPRQVNMQLWNWRGLDVINAHEREQDVYVQGIREAVDATITGRLDARPLFTHTFSLDELPEALQMTHDRPDCFIKALVMMQ
jgi:NADPH:quinone reductase